jgi:nitrogen fixation NifU-like protein
VTGRLILDHFRHPRNAGYLDDADGVGLESENPWKIAIEISLNIRNETIQDIRFRAQACVTSVACASALTEIVLGKPLEKAYAVSPRDLSEALENVPEEKAYCSRLAIRALHLALDDYNARRLAVPSRVRSARNELQEDHNQ